MKLTFKINKPAEYIFAFLTDMQKLVSVHPVITQIDPLPGNKYLVHEKLIYCFIPFSFTYTVTVVPDTDNKGVIITATVMRFTTIKMTYRLHTENGMTIVDENILISSPFPIKRVIERIFRKQHTQLFKNIEAT